MAGELICLDNKHISVDQMAMVVIPDEFLQNPNVWHVKVPLVNYATVEMHQSDRVLRNLESDNRFPWHSRCLMMSTKSTYELACVAEYMPWFRIYGEPYLLSEDEKRRQIRAQKERRGTLNPRRMDDDAGPSTAPIESPGRTV
ncbi:hypothetical protein PVK06_047954 [Gossypium arboreum]|uniref:Uncharacterized protein n=1 Tax=Gossypium arboreum TaxID=29729 RepID=A0ABR0MER4_GOSAR|nr:hypothetical protein PVK06_047954 [Gossypium arboreum]